MAGSGHNWGRIEDSCSGGLRLRLVIKSHSLYLHSFSQLIKAEFIKCHGKQVICTFSESIRIIWEKSLEQRSNV